MIANLLLVPKYEVLPYSAEDVTNYRFGLKNKKTYRGKRRNG